MEKTLPLAAKNLTVPSMLLHMGVLRGARGSLGLRIANVGGGKKKKWIATDFSSTILLKNQFTKKLQKKLPLAANNLMGPSRLLYMGVLRGAKGSLGLQIANVGGDKKKKWMAIFKVLNFGRVKKCLKRS